MTKHMESNHAQANPRVRDGLSFYTRFQTHPVGTSLTDQSMAPECDINRILAKYQKTGILDHVNRFAGSYGDFLDTPTDYQEAINQVMAADAAFADLPSTVRRRFSNDVGNFLQFVSDPNNRDEMHTLGLLRENPSESTASVIIPSQTKQEAKPVPSGT